MYVKELGSIEQSLHFKIWDFVSENLVIRNYFFILVCSNTFLEIKLRYLDISKLRQTYDP